MKKKDLHMHERLAYLKKVAKDYQNGTKWQKKEYLDIVVALTGYNRKYATHILANRDKVKLIRLDEKLIRLKAGQAKGKQRINRKNVYTDSTSKALQRIWKLYEYPCGRRLRAILDRDIEYLKGLGVFDFQPSIWQQLDIVSRSTIDRLLKSERDKREIKGRSFTMAGSLLKSQIPIRTFADWNENKPGFYEIDLVSHDGGTPRGDWCFTLCATDIHTGWTQLYALKNKAQKWTYQAIDELRRTGPFKILGIDSDNGSEFINHQLYRQCRDNRITFTRGRANKKNDNCYVEQKNNDLVRRFAGYSRYDSPQALTALKQLCLALNDFYNFFIPQSHTIRKHRDGNKVKRELDEYKTPYDRAVGEQSIDEKTREKLKQRFASLNIFCLKNKIVEAREKLFNAAVKY